MLDVENVMTILRAEVDKREKEKSKWLKYRAVGNKPIEDLYERRYQNYRSRFDGMCDMLYDLGYLAWADDDNKVFVVKREPYYVDEIPF